MLNFLNPWGFLFSLFIPAIILLYLLKQQYQEVKVSSTYLWQKTIQDIQTSMPWQKLRKNLLLFLQLLAVLLFTLAIARPFLYRKAENSSDFIIVLDCSASMQAEDVKPTRFLRARNEIEKFIDGLFPDQRVTLIAAGYEPDVVARRTGDKNTLKGRLKRIEVTNGGGSMDETLSLVQAIARELEDVEIHVYTDKNYEFGRPNYKSIVFNENGDNFAVDLISWTQTPDGPVILSRIANYSGENATLSVECLADGITADVKEIMVPADGTTDVYWTGIPSHTRWVEIDILDKDDLLLDNRGWAITDYHEDNRVLLVSQRNIFLEKAVTLRKDIELIKTTYEQADDTEGYSLYIFDGYIPESLPDDGNIIIFNPQNDNNFLNVGEEFVPGNIHLSSQTRYSQFLDFVAYDDFHIARARQISVPDWGNVVLEAEQGPLLITGEKGSQRIAVFSFDVHDSDIPLKMDFPILMQNMLTWMLPQGLGHDVKYYAGQEVQIQSMPGVQNIYVTTPSGERLSIDPTYSIVPINDAREVGIYRVQQDVVSSKGTNTTEHYFAVHVPTQSESDLRPGQVLTDTSQYESGQYTPVVQMKELWRYFAWILLAVILLEWWVYQYGY